MSRVAYINMRSSYLDNVDFMLGDLQSKPFHDYFCLAVEQFRYTKST